MGTLGFFITLAVAILLIMLACITRDDDATGFLAMIAAFIIFFGLVIIPLLTVDKKSSVIAEIPTPEYVIELTSQGLLVSYKSGDYAIFDDIETVNYYNKMKDSTKVYIIKERSFYHTTKWVSLQILNERHVLPMYKEK